MQTDKYNSDMKISRVKTQEDRTKVLNFLNSMKNQDFANNVYKQKYGWAKEYIDSFKSIRFFKLFGDYYFGWLAMRIDKNDHVLPEDIHIQNSLQSFQLSLEKKDEQDRYMNKYNPEDIHKGYLVQNGFAEQYFTNDNYCSIVDDKKVVCSKTGLKEEDTPKLLNKNNLKGKTMYIGSLSGNRELVISLASIISYKLCQYGTNVSLISLDFIKNLSDWDAKEALINELSRELLVLTSLDMQVLQKEYIKSYIQLRKDNQDITILCFDNKLVDNVGVEQNNDIINVTIN